MNFPVDGLYSMVAVRNEDLRIRASDEADFKQQNDVRWRRIRIFHRHLVSFTRNALSA